MVEDGLQAYDRDTRDPLFDPLPDPKEIDQVVKKDPSLDRDGPKNFRQFEVLREIGIGFDAKRYITLY